MVIILIVLMILFIAASGNSIETESMLAYIFLLFGIALISLVSSNIALNEKLEKLIKINEEIKSKIDKN